MLLNLEKSNRNMGFSKFLSTITLSVNGFNSGIKNTNCQIGSKCKIQQHAVYKKHNSQQKMHKLKHWKNIYQACRNQKQKEVAILLSDKADFIQ
jgi:hypothetical protein